MASNSITLEKLIEKVEVHIILHSGQHRGKYKANTMQSYSPGICFLPMTACSRILFQFEAAIAKISMYRTTPKPRNLFQRHNDQLPFTRQSRFSALPNFMPNLRNSDEFNFCNTVVYVVNIFGVFPLISLPSVLVKCGLYAILIVAIVCSLQVLAAGILGRCWIIAEKIKPELTSHIQT